MTPEEYADKILARLAIEPQGSWDADVVEFETKRADAGEVKAWIAQAIRESVAAEREACLLAAEDADCGGPECHLCGCRDRAVEAMRTRGMV